MDRKHIAEIALTEYLTDKAMFIAANEDLIDTLAHHDCDDIEIGRRGIRASHKRAVAGPALAALQDIASTFVYLPETLTVRERAIANLLHTDAAYWLESRTQELVEIHSDGAESANDEARRDDDAERARDMRRVA